jgi:glycosyltransferase involved in cell wall biosynthesis
MTRILHVVQSLDPAWGGIARVLPELAARLSAAGEQCRIATLTGDRFGSPPSSIGVEVRTFPAAAGSRLGNSPEFNRAIESLVADCDVIHLHGLWTAQNWSTGKAARKAGKPHIMTPHSMMMPWAWRRSWWKKRPIGWLFEHRNLRTAACLHALTAGEADAIRSLRFNEKIVTIANGLNVADYASPPGPDSLTRRFPKMASKKWIVMLGRIAEQKGIRAGMQGCFDALAAGGDWHLVIAGPDEFGMRPMLEAAVSRKGLTDHVTFTGMLERPDVLALLGHARLLLQPSFSEGLSMSILEAMAGGLPVLISTECNLPEVAASGAGRVIDPTRRAVAAAMRELVALADGAMREMGNKARELARERFDWSKLIPQYQQMYRDVTQR